MAPEIRILIVDDHPIVRQGLRQAIEADPGLTIVGEAGDGRSALDQIQALAPQIVVLDIAMPDFDGFDVAREIRDRRLAVEIIFLTVYREEHFFNEALSLRREGLRAQGLGDHRHRERHPRGGGRRALHEPRLDLLSRQAPKDAAPPTGPACTTSRRPNAGCSP